MWYSFTGLVADLRLHTNYPSTGGKITFFPYPSNFGGNRCSKVVCFLVSPQLPSDIKISPVLPRGLVHKKNP